MNVLALIALAAFCNSLALTLLKITGNRLRMYGEVLPTLEKSWWLVLLGLALYGVAFVLTIKLFSGNLFSRVVPTFIGINIVSSLLIAFLVFRETLSLGVLLGSALIIAGVWLVSANPL